MFNGSRISGIASPGPGWPWRVYNTRLPLIALGAMILWTGACSGFAMKIDPSELARLKDSPQIVAGHYKSGGLAIRTFKSEFLGQLQGPIIGAVSSSRNAYDLGAQTAGRYSLSDPSVELKAHFIGSISSKLGLGPVEIIPQPLSPPNAEDELIFRNKFRNALFFEFQMIKFEFLFEGLIPRRYKLVYRGSAALYKYSEGRYLWKSLCGGVYENPSQSPTFDDLTVNEGQVLKQMVTEATKACANELLTHFLSVAPPSSAINP